MTIKELMKEYNLEIDDIRWFLSIGEAQKLLSFPQDRKELIRYIWSGELETNLYNMEEKYLENLQEQMDRNITDESDIRDIFKEAELAAIKRKNF
ncbi:hypothetical protein [Spirochaeta isovalerica]|uniref:Putative membrane protein n=1 Tax=Spirochaeta isovalerica TaxID=150 RepID=A0A841R7I3_9SPIO|nr:hypothetical protein [Spirochaeta isovalerica]MBB6479000.1 putative membrane protein [Spirochaeta isovalerica]